jgi:hypothetical protein
MITGVKMKPSKTILFSLLILATMLACSAVSNFMATPTPVPTFTPVPTSTPPASPTPDPVLFEDAEFTNSCSTESTADVDRFVENGQFNLLIKTPKYVGWSECTKVEYSDIVIEADATQVAGPDNNMYGVLFRYDLSGNEFYVFAITGDGYYILSIDGSDHTEPDIITDWTTSSAINKGQQTNHLKVIVSGNSIQYFVNDQLLGEAQDERLTTGTVGFFAGTTDEGGVQVAFDNLKISKP